jgi:hypothetical protein
MSTDHWYKNGYIKKWAKNGDVLEDNRDIHNKWFRRAIKELDLTQSEQACYYALMEEWNLSRWQKEFTVWDDVLQRSMNSAMNTMRSALKGLDEKGTKHGARLLEFVRGNGRGKKPKYRMRPLVRKLNSDSFIDSFIDDSVQLNSHDSGSESDLKQSNSDDSLTAYTNTVSTKTTQLTIADDDKDNDSGRFSSLQSGKELADQVAGSESTPPTAAAPPSITIQQFVNMLGTDGELSELKRSIAESKSLLGGATQTGWFKYFAGTFSTWVCKLSADAPRPMDVWEGDFKRWIMKYQTEKYTINNDQIGNKGTGHGAVLGSKTSIPEPISPAKIDLFVKLPIPEQVPVIEAGKWQMGDDYLMDKRGAVEAWLIKRKATITNLPMIDLSRDNHRKYLYLILTSIVDKYQNKMKYSQWQGYIKAAIEGVTAENIGGYIQTGITVFQKNKELAMELA